MVESQGMRIIKIFKNFYKMQIIIKLQKIKTESGFIACHFF